MPVAAIIDPRRPDRQRTSTSHQAPFRSVTLTHIQAVAGLVDQPGVAFNVISDLGFKASYQHPPRPLSNQFIECDSQIVTVDVIGDYLQHQAYSFPAGHNRQNPFLRFGRVRRPSTRIRSSTTFGYSSVSIPMTITSVSFPRSFWWWQNQLGWCAYMRWVTYGFGISRSYQATST
ncbi:hypothetical protein HQ535_01335 [bacterium]|nr:hypothetical protein [bacterium]